MITRFLRVLTFSLIVFFGLSSTVALAQVDAVTEDEPAIAMEIDSLDDGPHFFGDNRLDLDGDYAGSVYAAGGEVRFTGTIDGDLVVMGGSVILDGTVTDDIYVAGGTVTINGDVGGTVTVAGASVTIGQMGEVVGSVVGAGKTFTVAGTILGDLMAGAENLVITGTIGQSARIEANRLELGDTAVIGENLQAEVDEESIISDKAQIVGENQVEAKQQTKREKRMSPVSWSANWLVSLVGRIIIMLLGVAIFGDFIKRAANIFDRRWPEALWKGAVFAVVVPFLVITLMITIIGFPAAMLVGLLYVLVMMTAWVVPGFWLGRLLVPKVSPYVQGVVGATVISIVTFVPIFGWVVKLLLAVLGTGALLGLWKRGK